MLRQISDHPASRLDDLCPGTGSRGLTNCGMSEEPSGKLKIYADFNSCMEDDRGVWCWLLRHNGKLLDEVANMLGLRDGLPVTLYYEDPGEEFEVDAVLGHIAEPGWDSMWMALPDWTTYRRLRG